MRSFADDLLVRRLTRLDLGAGLSQRRDGAGLAGFSLGDVGTGALADLEARARRAHLLGQEFEVALVQDRDLTVADNVHIG